MDTLCPWRFKSSLAHQNKIFLSGNQKFPLLDWYKSGSGGFFKKWRDEHIALKISAEFVHTHSSAKEDKKIFC